MKINRMVGSTWAHPIVLTQSQWVANVGIDIKVGMLHSLIGQQN